MTAHSDQLKSARALIPKRGPDRMESAIGRLEMQLSAGQMDALPDSLGIWLTGRGWWCR